MAFNLNDFKAELSKYGFMKANTYDCLIETPNFLLSDLNNREVSDRLRISTESISIPGVSFTSVDNYRPYGYGKTYSIPYSYIPQEINCVHIMDKNGENFKILTEWMDAIVAYQDKGARRNTARDFSVYYHSEYSKSMEIFIYNVSNEIVKTIKLNEVFPVAIDQMQMSWATSDDFVRLSTTYRYTNYIVNDKN